MATRDILNYLGDVIGELSLPDETTEEQWAEALAIYASPPPQPSTKQIIKSKVDDAIAFGERMVIDVVIENIAMGITQANKTKEIGRAHV